MGDVSTQARSNTMPTRNSTWSSASIKSKRILLYDMAENTTRKMSLKQFEKLYAGLPDGNISFIRLPKGASSIDICPDDLRHNYPEENYLEDRRCGSPEPIPDSHSTSPTSSQKSYSDSTQASVKIPWSVFLHRGIDANSYTHLVIITRPSASSSPKSSRSNTTGTNSSMEANIGSK